MKSPKFISSSTEMIDPLAEVVTLLKPKAQFSKLVSAAGPWRVRRSEAGRPFYCVLLDGACCLEVKGLDAIRLQRGDFVLIPIVYDFSVSSLEPPAWAEIDVPPVRLADGEFRHGAVDAAPDVQMLVGHCSFDSPDAALLASLLPQLIHVRDDKRLSILVQLLGEESRAMRPARDVILARLLEVLFIEALRSSTGNVVSPGLLRGLSDEHLAVAIRRIHEDMTRPWTVAQLAKESALSRSAFFERFNRALGVTPMEYLLTWRMAKAKGLLRRQDGNIAQIAERVGYGSASAFSVAFARHVGVPPAHYRREETESAGP